MLKTAGKYAAVYAGWIVGALLGGYALLTLWQTITKTYSILFPGSWGYGAVYMFSIVIIGLGWLVGVLLLEDYYRKGLTTGLLGKRFVRITIAELIMLVVPLVVGLLIG
ncbi:MAG: hypothetical protein ACYC5O_00075 [Anaerolineae bacterium]